jgi:hypothetical protein
MGEFFDHVLANGHLDGGSGILHLNCNGLDSGAGASTTLDDSVKK